MRDADLGRYSFLTADPVAWFQPDSDQTRNNNIWHWLDQQLSVYRRAPLPDLPPFQGGVAGLFSYELNSEIEQIESPGRSQTPIVALGLYDVVIAWDHLLDRCWLVSQGCPETDPGRIRERARQRANLFLDRLTSVPVPHFSPPAPNALAAEKPRTLPESALQSNFQRDEYLRTIQKALDYIHAGDIFQVNIAQQLTHPATGSSWDLFQQLQQRNPSTFAAWFDLGDQQIISASPERLVSVRGGTVETRPIKGTRRRTRRPEVDIEVARQLLASEKDRAENVMIVDLMRNDLSRVCRNDSIRVTQLVQLESYASVLHLVSAIQGQIRDDVSAAELLQSVFPGGSVTGAPKVRAMQIIAELEPTPRGAYCGSLGYFSLTGDVDLNILIRTITATNEEWTIPVGGGIVADSDPQREYEETWTKAQGMLAAIADLANLKTGETA